MVSLHFLCNWFQSYPNVFHFPNICKSCRVEKWRCNDLELETSLVSTTLLMPKTLEPLRWDLLQFPTVLNHLILYWIPPEQSIVYSPELGLIPMWLSGPTLLQSCSDTEQCYSLPRPLKQLWCFYLRLLRFDFFQICDTIELHYETALPHISCCSCDSAVCPISQCKAARWAYKHLGISAHFTRP